MISKMIIFSAADSIIYSDLIVLCLMIMKFRGLELILNELDVSASVIDL